MNRTLGHAALQVFLIASAVVFLAVPAWAVVVEFNVTNASGDPVPGATINVGGSDVGTTGDDGRAQADIDVENGSRREIVIRMGNRVLFREMREIRVGAPNAIAIPNPLAGRRAFRGGGLLNGGWFGASYGNESIQMKLDSQAFDIRSTLNGTVVPSGSSSGTRTPDQLAESNSAEAKTHRIAGAYGGSFAFALPGVGPASVSRRFAARHGVDQGSQPPAPGRGWRFVPGVSAGASRADVEFQSQNVDNPALGQVFAGDGLVWQAGVSGVVFPCASCGWFGSVGYHYARLGETGLTRSPALQGAGPGIRVTRDELRYRYSSHATRGTIGYETRHLVPWGGVRSTRWNATLDIDLLLDFSQRFDNQPAEQAQAFRNEYREHLFEGIAGVDLRIPGSPLVLRFEGSSDGDNHRFAMGVGVGIGR